MPVEQSLQPIMDYACGSETAYYAHIVLALRLPGVTVSCSLRIFAFYAQCVSVAGVSQPSSNVVREIWISQGPRSY